MNNYYFVASALPPLEWGVEPEITFEEVITLLQENLQEEDMEKIIVLRRYYDIQNMRNMLLDEPFLHYGNLTKLQMEEALNGFNGLPSYFTDYLATYQTKEERLKNFSHLLSDYYRYEIQNQTGFIRTFLRYEWEWRLVATLIRAKAQGRDILKELQFEDPNDEFVAGLLAQKEGASLEPPEEYAPLKTIYNEYGDSPLQLMKEILEWRFNMLENMLGVDLFSIERIAGYMLELILLERWFALDKEKGLKFVDTIVKEPS